MRLVSVRVGLLNLTTSEKTKTDMVVHTIGLDLSVNSPGFCHIDHSTGKVRLFAFQQLKKKHAHLMASNEHQIADKWFLRIFPFDKNSKKHTVAARVAQQLPAVREALKDVPRDAHIMCEGYSQKSVSNNILQLAEVQGAWRASLREMGFSRPIVTVPPSTAKKAFTGTGASGKCGMYEAFRARGGPDLVRLFAVSDGEAKPVQDLVDAYGLAVTWQEELELLRDANERKGRRKKRKREIDESFPSFF